jgi:hypothetical protein
MNMISLVPNGEQLEEGEVSEGDSVDEERADDSEGADGGEEDSEWIASEDDALGQRRKERRSKQNQDPEAVPSKTVASSTRNSKRGRNPTPESAGKAPKLSKPGVSKARKALPRMKITVPVAST